MLKSRLFFKKIANITGQLLTDSWNAKFSGYFWKRKQPFISAFSIAMAVPLMFNSYFLIMK